MQQLLEHLHIGPGPLITLLILASLGLTLTRATHIEGNQP